MYSTKEVENFSCFDRGCGLDQYCAEYGSVAGFCMHGSEHQNAMKGGDFFVEQITKDY